MLLFDGLFTDYFKFSIIFANLVQSFIPSYSTTVYKFRRHNTSCGIMELYFKQLAELFLFRFCRTHVTCVSTISYIELCVCSINNITVKFLIVAAALIRIKKKILVPNAKSPLASFIGFEWKIELLRGYRSQLPVAITLGYPSCTMLI